MQTITVKAPATVANLVCGFDVLGMCLHNPYDEMEVGLLSEKKIIIQNANPLYNLPTTPEENSAGAALIAMLAETTEPIGFTVTINKQIKPGSGLGSSAASAAGAVVAANWLLNQPFSSTDLVRFAMHGEKAASGVKHADNVAPAIFGGVTLVRSAHPLEIVSLPSPELFVAVAHPQIEVKTSDARQILRKEVFLKSAIKQWGNIAGVVASLFLKDWTLLSRSLEDHIIEPERSILIPCFNILKTTALRMGAIGGGIAGSGPSLFMLCATEPLALSLTNMMKTIFNEAHIDCHTYVTTINPQGVIKK